MKWNKYPLLKSSFLTVFLVAPSAVAKTVKKTAHKTVGELFSQASVNDRGAGVSLGGTKGGTTLPSANLGFQDKNSGANLEAVKPPRSSELMKGENADQAEYLKILDQQINELYKLTQKFRNSENRGELWLRLAELYVEKSTIIDSRMQDEYDKKLRAFQAGKTKTKPTMNASAAREYNKKAVQLYEWFQRDFPKDEKFSQALFFLGYNYFELGETKKAVHYYEELTKRFPGSPFSDEAHFSLAEYYFENEHWANAYKEYSYIIKEKKHRLYTFSLYKGAWCLFRLGKNKQALNYLEYIIKSGRAETGKQLASRRVVNRTRLEAEALRDIVVFYAEAGGIDAEQADRYFKNLVGAESNSYLERLAYYYQEHGNKDASKDVFRLLIAQNPNTPKAFEYQYQIVQGYYYGKNIPKFKDELYRWVKDYGPSSSWYQANKGNKELTDNSYKLRETTLRNYILQQHQTAQNSRAPYSQALANDGYQLYILSFSDSPNIGDMHFYYGELLYDMNKYDEASTQYKWVVENAPQSKFYGKAAQNLLLAVEKSVPSDQELQKRVGTSLEPVALEPKVERFIKSGQAYVEKFPNSDKNPSLKFRMGRLYYQSNHFDEATKAFREIVQKYPTTKYAEYSANLLLDIYNLRKDYAGLEKASAELLAVPSIASSKTGSDIRDVLEKAGFKKGQDFEANKKYAEAAQSYESFAKQNAKSNLSLVAYFNAALNYERAGQNNNAIAAYREVINSKEVDKSDLKWKSKRLLAKQYQDSAQYEEAAKLYRQASEEKPKDPLAPNLMFNAAALFEANGHNDSAVKAYTAFTQMTKRRSDNVEALYSMGQIHRKEGRPSAAIANYKEFLDSGATDKEKTVEAAYWISELSTQQRSRKQAEEWQKKTISIQRRFAPDSKGIGAAYAAKIKLSQSLQTFHDMKAVTFPRDPSKQKAAVNRKVGLLTQLTGELAHVIKYDSGEEIVSALAILGEANLNMAQAIVNAPLPPGLNPEETKQYKAGVEKFADPFLTKARESYKLAVDRGYELEIYSDSFHTARDYMNRQDPKTYYDEGEEASDTRLVNWMGQ